MIGAIRSGISLDARVFGVRAQQPSRGDPLGGPDSALTKWMDREEVLFRTLEKHLIGERLRDGFLHVGEPDVEASSATR